MNLIERIERMNKSTYVRVMLMAKMLLMMPSLSANESHAESIVSGVIDTRNKIREVAGDSTSERFVFLAIWDFDGTILKGDCSEGLVSDGGLVYKGLAQLSIESGYSEIYEKTGGVAKFWKDYRHMEENIGPWLAYPYIPQMLRGSKLSDLQEQNQKHFNSILSKYYFSSSLRILKALEAQKIENHIISASAEIFVKASSSSLGLSEKRIHGIKLRGKDGMLTDELIYPVTWGDGKRDKLISLVQETEKNHPGKQVIVLAAFGNSYSSDASFMKYVTTRALPAGRAIGVMINGGEAPEECQDIFLEVKQSGIRSN